MKSPVTGTGRRSAIIELVLFFSAVYAVTWAICGVYLFLPHTAVRWLGPMDTHSVTFFAAVYAPSVTAIVLTAVRGGLAGLRALGAAVIRIRVRWYWIVLSLAGYPLLWLIVALVQSVISGKGIATVPLDHWYAALPLLLLSGDVLRDPGALGEELGWRGYALPRLLEVMSARRAALVLGVIWAVWHLPAFFLSGLAQSKFNFAMFLLTVVSFSVFMTVLYVNTRGSILLAGIIPHMLFNATSKAGIHTVDGVTIALGAVLLLVGGRLWRPASAPSLTTSASTMESS